MIFLISKLLFELEEKRKKNDLICKFLAMVEQGMGYIFVEDNWIIISK